jgi:type II secretory pathway pseudopilin PulG
MTLSERIRATAIARAIMPVAATVAAGATLSLALGIFPACARAQAQNGHETDPAAALAAALGAACRADQADFTNYLTASNATAFRALPEEQRSAFLRRFSLKDEAGKPLLSSDDKGHVVVRCTAAGGTSEFRFGETRAGENLAFVQVTVVDVQETEFGLVRENGAWRLLSLGLVMLDIPQLSKQWAAEDIAAREEAAVARLRGLAEAIETYRRAYGKLPDSLAELGPAPKDEISPEQASLVDEKLAAGEEAGYRFRYHIVARPEQQVRQDEPDQADRDAYELAATPEEYPKNGRRSFFLDESGKVHGADRRGEVASGEDPLIAAESAESNESAPSAAAEAAGAETPGPTGRP